MSSKEITAVNKEMSNEKMGVNKETVVSTSKEMNNEIIDVNKETDVSTNNETIDANDELATVSAASNSTLASPPSTTPASAVEETVDGALVIDGLQIAKTIRQELRAEVDHLLTSAATIATGDPAAPPPPPCIAAVLVGDRPDSTSYVRIKRVAAQEVGIELRLVQLPESVEQEELCARVRLLNEDERVHAIIVQLPLPGHMDVQRVLSEVSIEKDVDGLHPLNMGRLRISNTRASSSSNVTSNISSSSSDNGNNNNISGNNGSSISGNSGNNISNINNNSSGTTGLPVSSLLPPVPPMFVPCTPRACMELLDRYGVDVEGKHAVVVGRSNIVGIPVAMLLLHRNATVTICHSKTQDLEHKVKAADIVVAALGSPEFIKGSWIKKGAVVIDVGINHVKDDSKESGFRLVGDVQFEEAKKNAAFITPVPGGVGPMTVAMLLKNCIQSFKAQLKL